MPFPRHLRQPIFAAMANASRQAEEAEGSCQADARQGGARALAADRAGAGEAAQSGHREGHRRRRLADRPSTPAAAAARQFVRPARRFRRRPQGARLDAAGVRARRRRRATSRRRRSGELDPDLARALGIEDEDASSGCSEASATPAPVTLPRQAGRRTARVRGGTCRAARGASGRRRRTRLPHRHHRQPGVARPAAARGAAGVRRAPVGAAPAAAAGEIRGRLPARSSSRISSRRATSRRRSPSWSRASRATTAPRCCSASPARARPSRWPR